MFFLVQFPGTQKIRVAYDSRQGCFQLMGKRRNKILPCPDLFLQLPNGSQHIGHAVEIQSQLPQFIAADLAGPVAVIPLCHPSGGMSQQPYGFCEPGTDQKHHCGTAYQHGQRHPPVQCKTGGPFFKYLGHILQCLQVQISVQSVDLNSCIYVIALPLGNHLPDAQVLPDQIQKSGFLGKVHTHIQNFHLLVGQSQAAARSPSAALQLGPDLFHCRILQHIVLGGDIQRRRLKGKTQNIAVIQRLGNLSVQGGLEHGIHKNKTAESKGHSHDYDGPQQNLVYKFHSQISSR